MNNSKFALEHSTLSEEETVDRTPELREREGTLIKILEAIQTISGSKEWSTLKTELFDGVVEKLERDLLGEAKQQDPDKQRLASLNGQFVWAKKYSDLDSLGNVFRLELTNIRKQLYGNREN